MPTEADITGEAVVAMCLRLGFALAGVCPAAPSARGEFFRRWLSEGRHGEMAWLARDPETRLDPARVLPGARSVIVVADRYAPRGDADPEPAPASGRVARYARGEDYHDVMKRRLHALCDALRERRPDHAFRACVDTAPVMEREHAARAGLGWIGKHTLLIHPRLGSWLLLGAVLTTLELDAPAGAGPTADHCGTCTRCIDACPTSCITPYAVDASRCVAYLTIERRGEIDDPALRAAIGDRLFGCDVCQEVCPHNGARPGAPDDAPPNPAYAPRFRALPAEEVSRWGPGDRSAALRGSAMKRATLEMLRRNAGIVSENLARAGGDAPPASP